MGLRDRLKAKISEAVGFGRPNGGPSRVATPNLPEGVDASGYRAVARSEQVAEGGAGTFEAGEAVVAVFRVQGQLYAIDSACAHEDGPLGEGDQHDGVVTCPYHGWRYDVRSGACLTRADRAVGCYAIKESGGLIWVGRRTREGSSQRGGEHDDGLRTT